MRKPRQDIFFWGILGAVIGAVDGILMSIIFSRQLSGFWQKLAFTVFSLNFYAIAGIVAGSILGGIFSHFKLEKIKAVLMNGLLLFLVSAYSVFYIKIFTHRTELYFSGMFFSFRTFVVAEKILLIIFLLAITYFLYRFYRKTIDIQFRWKYILLVVIGSLSVNIVIRQFFGQGLLTDQVHASATGPQENNRHRINNFKLPDDFTPPKNLLLIVIDTLRADHLGSYGYSRDTSPFIDKLARNGVIFENAIVQATQTSPSIASLFTSRYAHDHGVVGIMRELPDKYVTLAESYLNHNFLTHSIVANHNVGSEFNFDQGFENCITANTEVQNGSAADINHGVYTAAAKWLEQERGKPFFLYLHFIDPHAPYTPPKEFDVFTPDSKSDVIDIRKTPGDFHFFPSYALLKNPSEPKRYSYDLNYYISKYDGEILYSDSLVQKVIEKLDQLQLTGDTLIIITADHGESLGEHGYFFTHGHFTYEVCARVPFIIYYENGRFSVKSVSQIIELMDVYPTVHELMKLSYDKDQIKGQSFVSRLFGKNLFSKRAFLQAGDDSKKIIKSYAVRGERWKLVYNTWIPEVSQFFTTGFMLDVKTRLRTIMAIDLFPQRDNYELYDLKNDPYETKNLYRPGSELVSSLMKELYNKIKNVDAKHIQQVKNEDINENAKKNLKTLGYIQ